MHPIAREMRRCILITPEKPTPSGYRVWLIEQNLTRLFGEYLTEAMILARTAQEALAAACSLADPVRGFGLVVQRSRLRAVDYGLAPEPLPAVLARHRHDDALVLVVGTGADNDDLPADRDAGKI